MSAKVKLSSKLPGDEETNGLDSLAEQMVEEPHRIVVALVWLDVPRVIVDTDAGTEVPVVRVRKIEPLGDVGEVSDAVRKVAHAAHEKRTGKTPLPFDVVEYVDETLD